ncbi:MAG: hypothetical protein ACKOCT_22530 [Alphaproteobacteria bacterium]
MRDPKLFAPTTLALLALAACAPKVTTPPITAQDAANRAAAAILNPNPQATPAPGGIQAAQLTTATAKVVKINQKTRMATIKTADGRTKSFKVDPAVKNLAQVHAGDDVNVTYYEAIAIRLRKPGTAVVGAATSDEELVAKPGELPAAVAASATTVIAKIVGIDRGAQTATLQGPDGKNVTVSVPDKAKLDKAKVNDLVEITLTEALAISVDKVAK